MMKRSSFLLLVLEGLIPSFTSCQIRPFSSSYKFFHKKSNPVWGEKTEQNKKLLRKVRCKFSVKEGRKNEKKYWEKSCMIRIFWDQIKFSWINGFCSKCTGTRDCIWLLQCFLEMLLLITDTMSFFAFKWSVFAFEIFSNFG